MYKNFTILVLSLSLLAFPVFAFGSAPTPPPDCSIDPANPNYREGCFTPINVGAKEQIKNGSLGVNGFLNNGKSIFMGSVGIGTTNTSDPLVPLRVVGTDSSGKGISLTFENKATTNSYAGFNFLINGANFGAIHGGTAALGWGAVNGMTLSAGDSTKDIGFKIGPGAFSGTATGPAMILKPTGFIGMGTNDPVVKLDIVGSVKIADGTQGAGKVLTSDANGKGSWQYQHVVTIKTANSSINNCTGGSVSVSCSTGTIATGGSCSASGGGAGWVIPGISTNAAVSSYTCTYAPTSGSCSGGYTAYAKVYCLNQ